MKKYFYFILLVTTLNFLSSCTSDEKKSTKVERTYPDRLNAPEHLKKTIVLMISIDGFRNDYLEMYQPPTLLKWARNGVRSQGLVPSFPTLTFPNHMSLITGLRPGNHGIVGNRFFDQLRRQVYALGDPHTVNDGSWYRGMPIWTVAENQGMLSATAYWVGSEAKIGGIDPTYYKIYSDHTPSEQRITWVKEWLSLPENRRPHFISLYFSKVDTAGHKFGPKSEQVKEAIRDVDSNLAVLEQFIQENKMDVNIVLVSDHGMRMIDQTADISPLIAQFKMKTNGQGPLVTIYADDKNQVEQIYQEAKKMKGPFQVYNKNTLPKRWALNDHARRGDVVIVGDLGVYINFVDPATGKDLPLTSVATHGWDTKNTKELNGVFIATGSQFKKGKVIPEFDNVDVYPMILQVLGLENPAPIDGSQKLAPQILLK